MPSFYYLHNFYAYFGSQKVPLSISRARGMTNGSLLNIKIKERKETRQNGKMLKGKCLFCARRVTGKSNSQSI